MILARDMNDPPDGPAFAGWPDAGLVDALEDAVETRPPPPTQPEDTPPSAVWSHRFPRPNAPDQFQLFDHLWVSQALKDAVSEPKIHAGSTWTTDRSDHDPVSIRVELPG